MISDVCSQDGNRRDLYLKRVIVLFFVVMGTYRGPMDYRRSTNRIYRLELLFHPLIVPHTN